METNENEALGLISEIENDSRVNLKVPDRLNDPDVTVIIAKRLLSPKNENNQWSLRDDGVLSDAGVLRIRVSPKNVDRALRLFDTIIKAFRSRGHQFDKGLAEVDGQKYEISIREKLKKLENDYKKTPTDVLCIKVYAGFPRFEIYDSKNIPIENRIARVIAKIELEVKNLKAIWACNEKLREEQKEKERVQAECLAMKERELENFKILLYSAKRQFEANLIRSYILTVEENASQKGSVTPELENWTRWARDKADWYDPLVNKEDAILKDSDKLNF